MCPKLLTSYREVLSVFDVLCDQAERIEGIAPRLSFDRIGLWRVLQPHMERVKLLLTSAEVYDKAAWSLFHASDVLRLVSSEASAQPMSVWYFQSAQPSLLLMGADVLMDEGPGPASMAIYCSAPQDKALIAQARRWMREQKQAAHVPSRAQIEERAALNDFVAIDSELGQLQAITDTAQMQAAVVVFLGQLDEMKSPWPGANIPWPGVLGAEIRYRALQHYLLKVSHDSEQLLLAWSDGSQSGDSLHATHFFWNLECAIPLNGPQDSGSGGLAFDPRTERIFLVQYVDDEAFWRKARWQGVWVQVDDKKRRAVPLTWTDAPNMQQHLNHFAFERLRVLDKLPDKLSTQEIKQEDSEPILDLQAYLVTSNHFEHQTRRRQAEMIRLICAFGEPLSTRMLTSKGPAWIQETFGVTFCSDEPGKFLKTLLNDVASLGYVQNVQISGGHRYWSAKCKNLDELDDDLLDGALVYACQIEPVYDEDAVKRVKQILQRYLQMILPRGRNADQLQDAIKNSVKRCLENKTIVSKELGMLCLNNRQ